MQFLLIPLLIPHLADPPTEGRGGVHIAFITVPSVVIPIIIITSVIIIIVITSIIWRKKHENFYAYQTEE